MYTDLFSPSFKKNIAVTKLNNKCIMNEMVFPLIVCQIIFYLITYFYQIKIARIHFNKKYRNYHL